MQKLFRMGDNLVLISKWDLDTNTAPIIIQYLNLLVAGNLEKTHKSYYFDITVTSAVIKSDNQPGFQKACKVYYKPYQLTLGIHHLYAGTLA